MQNTLMLETGVLQEAGVTRYLQMHLHSVRAQSTDAYTTGSTG